MVVKTLRDSSSHLSSRVEHGVWGPQATALPDPTSEYDRGKTYLIAQCSLLLLGNDNSGIECHFQDGILILKLNVGLEMISTKIDEALHKFTRVD